MPTTEKQTRKADSTILMFLAFGLLAWKVFFPNATRAFSHPGQTGQRPVIEGEAKCRLEVSELSKRLAIAESRLKDWPMVGYYRQDNVRLPPPADVRNRVVFLGDSIIGQWFLGQSFSSKPYVNRAISGQVSGQMLVRFRRDVVALKPKAVIILGGINDLRQSDADSTLEDLENNLQSMAEIADANGIRVVLASVLPVLDNAPVISPTAARPSRLNQRVSELNAWSRNYAENHHAIFLDFYSAVVGPGQSLRRELTNDGLHPNDRGYREMTPLAALAIEKALAVE